MKLEDLVNRLVERADKVAEMHRLAEAMTMMAVNNGEPWMYRTAAELRMRAKWIEESTMDVYRSPVATSEGT